MTFLDFFRVYIVCYFSGKIQKSYRVFLKQTHKSKSPWKRFQGLLFNSQFVIFL